MTTFVTERYLHPPYVVPHLDVFAEDAREAKHVGLFNVRVTGRRFRSRLRINIEGEYIDPDDAPGGITISLYWEWDEVIEVPLRYLRIGDLPVVHAGQMDSSKLEDMGMEGSLADSLALAVQELESIYEDALLVARDYLNEANIYAIARLDRTAHARSRTH